MRFVLLLLGIAHAAANGILCSLCHKTNSPIPCNLICRELQRFQHVCKFSSPPNNLRAVAASTDPLGYATTILSDLAPTASHLKPHSIIPGPGSYDLCHTIPGASFCSTGLLALVNGTMVAIPGAAMHTCVNRSGTCDHKAVAGLWKNSLALAVLFASHNASHNTTSKLPKFDAVTKCGDHEYEWETGSYIWMCIVSALVLMTLVFTGLNITTSDNYHASKLSIVNHWNDLITPRPAKIVTGCMDGIRWMSMCWVVMGHSLLWPLQLGVPYLNQDDVIPAPNINDIPLHDPVSARFSGQAIQAAEFSVDSFFFMSGFLAVFIGLKKLKSLSSLSVLIQAPMMVLDRFLRLTPTYMLVLFALTYIVPLTSHGPYWETANQPVIDACKANWWHNILYAQSIMTAIGYEKAMCFNVSWYLADDMVFFCLIPLVLALAKWNRMASYLFMLTLATVSIITAGVTSYQDKWTTTIFDFTSYNAKGYFPPWFRVPPYLLGCAFALAWTDHDKAITALVKSRRVLRVGLWCTTAFLLLITAYGISSGAKTNPSSTPQAAMDVYIAVAKTAWCVGVMTLCVLCFTGCGGIANWFLASPFMGVMGKLTYCTYLVHVPIITIVYGSRVSGIHFSTFEYAHAFVGFLGLAAALALVLHLFVEIPTSKVIDILLCRKPKSTAKPVEESKQEPQDCWTHERNNDLNQNLIVV